jgi:malonyl-CoA O-methyltransferase
MGMSSAARKTFLLSALLVRMSDLLPPTIDPVAAARWHQAAPPLSPWLHEEIARRMDERLEWIVQAPRSWCHWEPVRGGLQAHGLLAARYPQAGVQVHEGAPRRMAVAQEQLGKRWWQPARWLGGAVQFGPPAPGSVDMLWANMALHTAADPQQLIRDWHQALAVDGYVMFSCLGPDTLRELHAVYAELGWPVPGHTFTDMHDWGDMLVQAGFAEPVMDMEHITLTFATPQRLLQELRELGCNLHPQRFAGLRGRQWRRQLEDALQQRLASPAHDGQLALTFEIVYGHAYKPAPRLKVSESSAVSLEDMRSMLRGGRNPGLR